MQHCFIGAPAKGSCLELAAFPKHTRVRSQWAGISVLPIIMRRDFSEILQIRRDINCVSSAAAPWGCPGREHNTNPWVKDSGNSAARQASLHSVLSIFGNKGKKKYSSWSFKSSCLEGISSPFPSQLGHLPLYVHGPPPHQWRLGLTHMPGHRPHPHLYGKGHVESLFQAVPL